jgi:hypothetical protein
MLDGFVPMLPYPCAVTGQTSEIKNGPCVNTGIVISNGLT